MSKELLNVVTVMVGLWYVCIIIASVEEAFVALNLSRPAREVLSLLFGVVGAPLWALVMSTLMIV